MLFSEAKFKGLALTKIANCDGFNSYAALHTIQVSQKKRKAYVCQKKVGHLSAAIKTFNSEIVNGLQSIRV